MINNIITRVIYQGDGETKEFPFPFKILTKADIKVAISDGEEEMLLHSDYFVDMDKGTVLYPGYPPGEEPAERLQPMKLQKGWSLAIYRDTPATQESTYGKKWPFDEIEDSFDKATMIEQELKEQLERTVRLSDTTGEDVSVKLPIPTKGCAIGWSYDEKSLINIPVGGGGGAGIDYGTFEKKWTYYNRRLKELEKLIAEREKGVNKKIEDLDNKVAGKEKENRKKLGEIYETIKKVDNRVDNIDTEIEDRIKSGESHWQTEIKKETSKIYSQITQLNDVINSKISDTENKTGTQITQLKDSITALVGNKVSGLESRIVQLDNAIDTRITDRTKGMETRITQLSNSINMDVINKLKEVASQVTQLDDTILAKVTNKLTGLESRIVQLDNAIDSKITDKTKGMDTRITQLSESITSTVKNKLSGMESRVDQFADLIKTRITNRLTGVESRLAQMDDIIESKVEDKARGIESQMGQLSDTITAQVTDKINKAKSEITQVGDAIELSVEGKADKDRLISQINLSKEKIKLDGRLVEITGKTVFKDDVIIKGNLIQPNSINSDRLNVKSLSAITATIGTLRTRSWGARVEISDNLIQVFDRNNQLRVRIGVWDE